MDMPAQIQLKTVKMVEIEPESDVPSIGLMNPNPRSFHRQTTPFSHPLLVPPLRLPPRGDRDRDRDRRRRAGDRDRDRRRRAGDRDLRRWGDLVLDLARSPFGDLDRDLDRDRPRSRALDFPASVGFGDPAASAFSGSGDGISCEL